jgi:exo-beta-1,3-glucanase (GH17 family)
MEQSGNHSRDGVNGGAASWRGALLKALPNFADYIDNDGWHFYAYPDNNPPSSLAGQTQAFITSSGVTKPSWITEGGYQSLTALGNGMAEMTPALQAAYLPELINLVVGIELIEAFFIYCLADYGTAGQDAGYWGLIDTPPPSGPDTDSNPKPSFAAIQSFFA